jgi:predicted GIY-YIG superfamily endonuclease
MDKTPYCYLLRNDYEPHKNRTYNGYTVNPKRRIRQHNQEIKGGAKYTKKWGNKKWEMYVIIKGFPDSKNALQCEWKIKHPAPKKRRPYKYNSPEGRVIGLNEILKLDRWTRQSCCMNKDINLEIWIVKEYAKYLVDIPNNYIINVVDKINFDYI